MTDFTPFSALAGGVMIGLAAVLLMALHGKIAGVSGIVAGLLPPVAADGGWRAAFLVGAIIAPLFLSMLFPVPFQSTTPIAWLVPGGVLVGIGVTLASGCTSGHGVCGLARLSRRSLVATRAFMATSSLTVFVIRHVAGGF